jgi:tetratricopeptide (TPR) repeat protein
MVSSFRHNILSMLNDGKYSKALHFYYERSGNSVDLHRSCTDLMMPLTLDLTEKYIKEYNDLMKAMRDINNGQKRERLEKEILNVKEKMAFTLEDAFDSYKSDPYLDDMFFKMAKSSIDNSRDKVLYKERVQAALFELGCNLETVTQLGSALSCFEKMIEIDPNSARARSKVQDLRYRLGEQ